MIVYVLQYPYENCIEFRQVALKGYVPRSSYSTECEPGADIIRSEPFDANNKEHCEMALDAYYTNVIRTSVIIPGFRKWLEMDLSVEDAEKVIQGIKWYG
jgi:hypothetical protein